MTPAQSASQVPSHGGFASDLAAHFAHGIVISMPEFFFMVRPVRRNAPQSQLLNPWWRFGPHADAWMIWLGAGDMRAALAWFWPQFGAGKSWLAFQADGPARFIRVNLLLSLYGQRQQQ